MHPPDRLGRHPDIGDSVGGFRLTARVGAGGMATVYRATDATGRDVAVKVLNPATVVQEDVARFAREYRALQRVNHPHVVRTYDAGVADGYPWIAMEFVDGEDLGARLDRWAAAPPPDRFQQVETILRGLCRALQSVHDLGLIHRDLKPGNILLDQAGTPKLSDFGVVKDGAGQTQLTMVGRLVGTVAFMAPEQITGETLDHRTDLYALGAILYMMLTLRRPIEATSVAGYLARHLTEVPRSPSELDPTVPRHLERICMRLLQKDRAARYPSAQAVLHAMDRRGEAEVPPLRGREAELVCFAQALQQLGEGASATIYVTGPPGVGKTHLFRSCLEQVANSGAVGLYTQARDAEPLADLLTAFRQTASDPNDAATRLRRALLGVRAVIAIDDLDRADAATLDALSRLVRERIHQDGQPIVVLFTGAPDADGLTGLATGLTTGVPCTRVSLGPLDGKAVAALLRDRGLSGAASTLLGRRLAAELGGMPGRILDQLHALRDQGWLRSVERPGRGAELQPVCSLDALRRDPLPVSDAARDQVRVQLAALDGLPREVAELLACLDRPASAALLERCVSAPDRTDRAAEHLVQRGLAAWISDEQGDALHLADPFAARVIRADLPEAVRRDRHAAIAGALAGRRSRAGGVELGGHQEAAGQLTAAYQTYVQAARRSARESQHAEVLDLVERLDVLRDRAEPSLAPDERDRARLWTELARGEAQLARSAWIDAEAAFAQAIPLTEAHAPELAARALAGQGRALYRLHRLTDARAPLEAALRRSAEGAPERAAALRALGDIQLQAGDLPGAEARWGAAIDLALATGSRDGEARARRGMAHLRAIQGRVADALTLLGQADDLLQPDGDARVRAGVLHKSVELGLAAGRYGQARQHAEALVDLARRRDLGDRLPVAYGAFAVVLAALGDREEARDAAHQALVYARALGPAGWEGRLFAAVVLADLGDRADARAALPEPGQVPESPLDDAPAWATALRARVTDQPDRAAELARGVLARPPAILALRAARIAIDAGLALLSAGAMADARAAAKQALRLVQTPDLDGLRLEALVVLQRTGRDERVAAALTQAAQRVQAGLPAEAAARLARRIERSMR